MNLNRYKHWPQTFYFCYLSFPFSLKFHIKTQFIRDFESFKFCFCNNHLSLVYFIFLSVSRVFKTTCIRLPEDICLKIYWLRIFSVKPKMRNPPKWPITVRIFGHFFSSAIFCFSISECPINFK